MITYGRELPWTVLADFRMLTTVRRHFKVLRYVVGRVDDLGAKLSLEPETYERQLTAKHIKSVLGRYPVTDRTLKELVEADFLEKKVGSSSLTIYLPNEEGRLYLQHLRTFLEGLSDEIRRFSTRLEKASKK